VSLLASVELGVGEMTDFSMFDKEKKLNDSSKGTSSMP
jgi:hypothetical protein